MSRIGKAPIQIPSGVEVSISPDNVVRVKSSKGTLTQKIHTDAIKVSIGSNEITVETKDKSLETQTKAFHGLYRMLIANMVQGVTQGFEKQLELVGVGYRASVQGNLLDLSLGYSHNVVIEFPSELKITAAQEKGSNPIVTIQGIDKQLVGLVASKIRSLRKPEPYQGKGVKYVGEYIRRKAGKSASSK